MTLGRIAFALSAIATLGLITTTATTQDAKACGGFFCSQVPIDQSGERIIFSVDEGSITAYIQISFTGEAEDFAWVIPIASQPSVIDVGSNSVIDAVAARTEPRFWLNWQYNDNGCGYWGGLDFADGDPAPSAGGNGEVQVVAEEEVGPYNTVLLESTDAVALYNWLDDNGFDQPEESIPLISHYLDNGMLFLAVKLKQGGNTQDIAPIVLTFEEDNPCVPLILTQIAATPDMPVRLWVLSEHRTVPTNWMHVTINEQKIDWLNNGSNYNDVVTQAVNEAAGHGFVTEFAGSSEFMKEALYREGQFDLDKFAAITDPAQIVDELMMQGFPRDETVRNLLREHIPMPQALIDQGVDERDFYNCLSCYEEHTSSVDGKAFADDLKEKVVEPLEAAQLMFDSKPYLTRLYSTVSPDEMNRDPLFAQNPDLPDVSNVHEASAEAICDGETIEKIVVTLADETTFEIPGPIDPYEWPIVVPETPDVPAAKKIELLGTSGPGEVVDPSQVEQVDQSLDTMNPEQVLDDVIPNLPPPTTNTGGNANGGGGVSGCAATAGATPFWLVGALLALFALARRREA